MGIRSTVGSALAAALGRPDPSAMIEEALAMAGFMRREDVEALLARGGDNNRVATLEAKVEALSKKLSMTMGTVSASATALQAAASQASEALATARQAQVVAQQAKATAESAVDGTPTVEDGLCQVPNCGKPHRARGYCAAHYNKWRRGAL